MTNRKIISDAWTEKSPLYVCGSKYWIPGLRELGADEHREHAAGEEEEDRRDEVLDADHLVVGVDAEVVLPALRAVAGVVLGPRRLAERVVHPVVEGADAGEEAERRRRRAAETRTIGCQSRIGCQPPHQRSTTTIPKPIAPKRHEHPGARGSSRRRGAAAARCRAGRRGRVRVVVGGRCGHVLGLTPSCSTGSDTGRARRAAAFGSTCRRSAA